MHSLAICLLGGVLLMQSPESKAPPGVVKIDGETHPERIPDHWVWRAAFRFLTEIQRTNQQADISLGLPLSAADAAVLYREAAAQASRDATCQARVDTKKQAMEAEHAKPDAIGDAIRSLLVECNAAVLDAADRVVDALSEEGRVACHVWLERRRRSTTLLVPESDLKVYALPR